MTVLAISGTRTALTDHDKAIIRRQLGWGRNFKRRRFVRIGDCPTGVDRYLLQLFTNDGFCDWDVYEADWNGLGPAAGPNRNLRMLIDPTAVNVAMAFPRHGEPNKGTLGFAKLAMAQEIKTLIVHWLPSAE